MFKPVSAQADFRKIEDAVQKFWKERRIFAKITAARRGAQVFTYDDIPVSASSKPTLSDSLAWTYKDVFLRYQSMRGKNVLRRGAWLSHGLPVEIEAEKHLGINSKEQIETVGLDRFVETCRRAAFHYTYEWEKATERMGNWIDWNDAFGTHTNAYIESVWAILKGFWDKGLITQRNAVVPYCPRCGTPLSSMETQQINEPSPAIFIRLPVVNEPGTSLLIWTAKPWNLPACTAVAVQPDADYVKVERHMEEGGSERLILAKAHLDAVFSTASLSPQISFLPAESIKTISEFKGKKLKGLLYRPLFTALLPEKPAHFVVLAEEISLDAGSGIHPIIPAFDQADLTTALENDLPVSIPVQPDGTFIPEMRPWSGKSFGEVNLLIIDDLILRGLVLRSDLIEQAQPFCIYCRARVMEYLRPIWVLDATVLREPTTPIEDGGTWLPAELRAQVDLLADSTSEWIIGRDRYYGTPLPIWSDEDGCAMMPGSLAELASLAKCDPAILDPHRPAIDGITFAHPKTGNMMHRVPQLVDMWFDLGAMPAAQWHYPFEGKHIFEKRFPADLASSRLDGPPRWLYTLQTVSGATFNRPAFRSAVGLGNILNAENLLLEDEDAPLKEFLEQFNADALRWFWVSSTPAGNPISFAAEKIGDQWNAILQPLWKAYAFFVTFANLKGWQPDDDETREIPPSPNPLHAALDRWLLSFLHETMRSIDKAYDSYDLYHVANSLQEFVLGLAEWYLPRTHHRFWMSANDIDEKAAFRVVFTSLNTLCRLFAPIAPFTMEEVYQNLTAQMLASSPESVHLADWPEWDAALIDADLNRAMSLIIHLAELGHAAIGKVQLKPGRSFREAIFTLHQPHETAIVETYAALLMDALHVKQVRTQISPHDGFELVESQYSLFVSPAGRYQVMLTAEPTQRSGAEDIVNMFIQQIQELRRQAGYHLTVPVQVYLAASKTLTQSLLEQRREIMRATLAVEIVAAEAPAQAITSGFVLANEMITLGITKATQEPPI